jgi:hypothetical protein
LTDIPFLPGRLHTIALKYDKSMLGSDLELLLRLSNYCI